MQNAAKHDDVAGQSHGIVDLAKGALVFVASNRSLLGSDSAMLGLVERPRLRGLNGGFGET